MPTLLVSQYAYEFNDKSLTPTYKLLLGVSGSSNAFNIARMLGLNDEVLKDAERLLDESNDESRNMVNKIEQTNQLLIEKERLLEEKIKENESLKFELNNELNKVKSSKDKLLKDAYDKANSIKKQDLILNNY